MHLKTWLFSLLLLVFLSAPWGVNAQKTEYVYALADTTLQRWSDVKEPTTVRVEAGERLEVVYHLDGLVRVRVIRQRAFGWFPEDKVSKEKPQMDEEAPGGTKGANAIKK